ncbi:hypothetical protein Tco_1453053, partial [Tanacetum coccineum]
GNPQQDLKDKGVIDSGCSRHIIGNRSYLTVYEEIDGGFVAFGGNSKGEKNTGKADYTTNDDLNGMKKLLMMKINFLLVKTVNGEVQIQALVDKKKVIITETSIRSDLQLEDAEAFFSPHRKFLVHTILQCLSAKTTAWNEFSITMAYAVICLAINQKFNFSKYIFDNMVKNLEGGVKFIMYPRAKEKVFSGRVTPLFQTMMVQAPEELGEVSEIPTDPQHTPTINQPSSSQPPKKKKPRKTKKQNTEVSQPSDPTQPMADETEDMESVPIHSNNLLLSGEDRLKLNELMELCTK